MNSSHLFVIVFFVGTVFSFALGFILERIDFSFRKKHGRDIPEELRGIVDEATLEKTCRYEDAKYGVWIPSAFLDFALSIYLVWCRFYPAAFDRISQWTGSSFLVAALFLVIASVPGAILSIPFSLYSEFVIEKHFGFSNMTLGMWILDSVKSLVLSLLIMLPLLAAMIALFSYASEWWWLFLACVYVAFSLAISVIYPIFIAPLFNTFTPLEDGELKTRLESLLSKCGFTASGLFVMDASKRSGHSNAYFTGFGKSKRVVLYDTLIEQLSTDEIEAVLGHELGHYKHKHIAKRMALMIPAAFAVLFAVSALTKLPNLYSGFGFSVSNAIPSQTLFIGMFLLSITFEGFSPLVSLVMNAFSRKDEFQADAFSKKICGSEQPLISALIKLNKENLSEIQVPKIYSAFNYNHPPLLERIAALKN